MSGSDLKLTESIHTLEEAADLGEPILETATWDEFPIGGISTSGLRSFGQRLRDYGINGCLRPAAAHRVSHSS